MFNNSTHIHQCYGTFVAIQCHILGRYFKTENNSAAQFEAKNGDCKILCIVSLIFLACTFIRTFSFTFCILTY